MTILTAKQEADCLAYDPFAGDFGDQADRILQDRFNTSNKEYDAGSCVICFGNIAKDERYRKQVARIDHDLRVYRFCAACCAAMALARLDGGKIVNARHLIGARRRNEGGDNASIERMSAAIEEQHKLHFSPWIFVLIALGIAAYALRWLFYHG